ncbi:hypothetical protein Tco_0240917, partial [Tanacetum coccineum]
RRFTCGYPWPELEGKRFGVSISEAWTRFKDLLQKVPHHGIGLWLQVQILYVHVNITTKQTIDQSAGGKLHDKNAEESWALLEDLPLYNNESWNDLKDFAIPVKAISLPQDVLSTSDCRLIELENQVQHLMEAHLAPNPPVQVNKIASSCEICSGPHDTQYCMENPDQAFVDYASSRNNKVGGKLFTTNQGPRNFNEATNAWKGEQNRNSTSPKRVYFINTITIISKEDEPREARIIEPNATKDNNHNTIVEIEKKVGEELSGSETVLREGESQDIKWDNPDDRMCGDTKELEEVEEESEELEEEVEKELE